MTTDTTIHTAVEQDARSGYITGLRALADILDAHPEVPLPFHGSQYSPLMLSFLSSREDARQALAAATRALPGRKDKRVRNGEGEEASYYDVETTLYGLHLKLTAFRDQVCERVVTGTREVTKEVPDLEALAAVPTVTVTETVEDIEWVCSPLLADKGVTA